MDKFSTVIKAVKSRLQMHKVPQKYVEDYVKLTISTNMSFERTVTLILVLLNILLIIVDYFVYWNKWTEVPAYRNLFFLHILALSILTPYYFCLNRIFNNCGTSRKLHVFSHIFIIVFVLVWCVLLAINDQFIHGQISAYVIGIFCVSALLILKPLETFVIYSFIYLLFVSCLFLFQSDSKALAGNMVNGALLTILAFVVAVIRYNSHVTNFKNEKIIIEKTLELDISRRNLELAVEKRTEELNKANELLINEINTRHKAELKAVQVNYLYEEKLYELNNAREYEKLRTAFFANISHELRTPLNLIFSAEQMLEKSIDFENSQVALFKVSKYSKIIKQNCYRLIRIINNLIDITRIDAGFYDITLGNHDIVSVVEDITMSVAEYTKSKNINLTFDTDIEEKIIACDPDKIERIMLNLLSNAIKFTPQNGNINVNICTSEDYIFISVKDDGIGIPEEMQSTVFDKFVQVDNSITRATEGSGIGLSLVKSLVDMHGGSISLRSNFCEGSEFIIKLPVATLQDTKTCSPKTSSYTNRNVDLIHIEFSDIYLNK